MKLRLLWDFLMLFVVIGTIIFIPFMLTFERKFKYGFYVFFFTFFIDIIISIKTGFYSKGILITDSQIVFMNYFKNKFFLDLISLIPFIISFNNKNYENLAIFLLFQSLRIRKISIKLNEYLQLNHVAQGIFDLIKLSVFILLIAHFFACFFHYIAILEIKSGENYTWLHSKNLLDKGIWEKYVNSMYFSVVTMITVGYGDITPHSYYEKIFCIIFMQISCIAYGYIINSIGKILMELDKHEHELK